MPMKMVAVTVGRAVIIGRNYGRNAIHRKETTTIFSEIRFLVLCDRRGDWKRLEVTAGDWTINGLLRHENCPRLAFNPANCQNEGVFLCIALTHRSNSANIKTVCFHFIIEIDADNETNNWQAASQCNHSPVLLGESFRPKPTQKFKHSNELLFSHRRMHWNYREKEQQMPKWQRRQPQMTNFNRWSTRCRNRWGLSQRHFERLIGESSVSVSRSHSVQNVSFFHQFANSLVCMLHWIQTMYAVACLCFVVHFFEICYLKAKHFRIFRKFRILTGFIFFFFCFISILPLEFHWCACWCASVCECLRNEWMK